MEAKYKIEEGRVLKVEDVTERAQAVREHFNTSIYPALEQQLQMREQYVQALRQIDADIEARLASENVDRELIAALEPEKAKRMGF